MGRIRTQMVKRLTAELIERYGPQLKKDYAENKVILENYMDVPSKKLKNILVGSVTAEMKKYEG